MYKNILVINTTGMGDCLWGTPALRSLKESFPQTSVHFLVNRKWISLFKGNPHIDHLHGYKHTFFHQLLLLFSLRRFFFDRILIFHANKDIERLLRLLNSGDVLAHQPFPWLRPGNYLEIKDKVHGIQRNLELVKKAGARQVSTKMEIFFEPSDLSQCEDFMQRHGLMDGEMVYLNTGGSYISRRWPLDSFAKLIRLLRERDNFRIVLGGGPAEQEPLLRLKNSLPDSSAVVLSNGLPLKAEAALIQKCRLMVTSDTGPMHIGFAVGTPVISIYGPTDNQTSGPYQLADQEKNILQSTEICADCNYVACKTPTCMEAIPPERVMEKISALLSMKAPQ